MIVFIVCAIIIIAFCAVSRFVFNAAIVRSKKPPVQGVDRPEFVSQHPDMLRQINAGRKWYHDCKKDRVELRSYDGLRLVGYYIPVENARGTILTMHGYRSDCVTDFSCAYEYYHGLGLNILNINQRAHGESEGKYICFGVKERYDCLSWANWIAERNEPEHNIFIGGVSMGASTVMMASNLALPKNVRGIIADCGFTQPWLAVRHTAKELAKVPPVLVYLVDLCCRLFAGFSLKQLSTTEALAKTSIPFIFIHGEGDLFVPCYMSHDNYAACASEKELITVPEAGHGLSILYEPERCKKSINAFIDRHCV